MVIIGDLYVRNAHHDSNGVAVIYGDQTVTHAQLLDQVETTVRKLMELGLDHQDRFAILAKNSVEYIELYGAAEMAGYVAVAVNYRLAAEEMAYIINDSAPRALFFEDEFADVVEQLRSKISVDVPLVCIGRELPWAHSYRTLAQSRAALPRARASDLVYLIYTSGTSGRPKGAMLNQKGQLEFGRVIAEETALTGRDRMLIVMPLYHVGAKCNQLAALYRGCPLVVMRNYSALDVASAIESHAVTVAHLAPLMVAELVALAKNQSFNRGTLRLVQYASGPMPVAQLREAVGTYGQIFMQMYGMTEAGVITVLYPEQHILEGDPDVVRRLGSAGVSPPSAKVKVVDDNGRECPVGVQGEVVAFTPSLLRGYWNSTVATHDALSDGWLKTGDIGWLDSSGFLFIVDRKKEVIISGGENIYPREVEEALHFHPAVEAVAVIGVPDEKWGEAVKAFVVTTKTKSTTEAELIEFCKTKLASYKKPKSVQFVDRLPRLANQKIDKKALREPFWRGRSSRV